MKCVYPTAQGGTDTQKYPQIYTWPFLWPNYLQQGWQSRVSKGNKEGSGESPEKWRLHLHKTDLQTLALQTSPGQHDSLGMSRVKAKETPGININSPLTQL